MDDALDILVMEAQPHTNDDAIAALEAAGHRLHRCHDADSTGFPCRGAVDRDACPVDLDLDVALLMRRGVRPHPSPLEAGATCAIRADVPIVEIGTDLLDPFAPWIARRIANPKEAPDACAEVASEQREPLRRAIHDRIAALLAAGNVDPGAVTCTISGASSTLEIHLELPHAVGLRLEHALAVRVLDAVRSSGRTYGHIDVSVSPSGEPPAAEA
ncbi:MAG: hypothetical protein ABL966_01860 [Acidimicrobiales bacterium]